MSDQGFIILHRKIIDNPVFQNAGVLQLFLTLLLLANHKEERFLWNGTEITVGRGQLITGRIALSERTGQHPSKIYRNLEILKKLGIVNIKPNNKFSLITIVKYSDYQDKREKPNNKPNNHRTSNEQPPNTNNNDNNDNNDNNINTEVALATQPLRRETDFFENLNNQEKVVEWIVSKGATEQWAREQVAKFISYWTETNSKGKMRWQGEKYFEVKKRLVTWLSRAGADFKKKPPEGRTRKVIKL